MIDEAMPLLALLFFLGRKKKTTDPNAPKQPGKGRKCNVAGEVWSVKHNRCVPASCPTGFARNPETGLCTIQIDGPTPEPEHHDPIDNDVDDYPTDGKFFPVKSGWIFAGEPSGSNNKRILYNAIAQRAFLVGKAHGMNDDEARAFGKSIAQQQSNRSAFFSGIQRDPWNDQLSATYGYSDKSLPDECTKRAIRLLPQHADNLQRLRDGLAPIRSIRLRTPNDRNKGNGLAAPGAPKGHHELLWLNPIDEDHLWLTHQVRVLMTGPPEWVRELGIIDRSGDVPPGFDWGC